MLVARAVEDAHAGLRAGVAADPDLAGMATTLTAVVTDGTRVVLGHVGDSRAYLLRDGAVRQVSRDHTYVQHLVDTGQLDPGARFGHPWSNVVTALARRRAGLRPGRHRARGRRGTGCCCAATA